MSIQFWNKRLTVKSSTIWFGLLIATASLFKLWLVTGQGLSAVGSAWHDDRLFVELANELRSGNWLGTYNERTLIKGPFYPMWIVIMRKLSHSLVLSHIVFYILACGVFTLALKPLFRNLVWLVLLYLILLFNPASFTAQAMSGVLREGIYPALTLLVMATAVAVLLHSNGCQRKLKIWLIWLGIFFTAFWLIREEGLWLLPPILVLLAVAVCRTSKTHGLACRHLLLYTRPVLICLLTLGLISGLNKLYYGTSAIIELRSTEFLAAYGALTRVKPAQWHPMYPVPREMRERIYTVSPAFAELKPWLEGEPGQLWSNQYADGSDIAGTWFMWAFREFVARAGYYSSWQTAATYYQRLAQEINAACEKKQLDCGPQRYSTLPPWHAGYWQLLRDNLARAIDYFISYEGVYLGVIPTQGPKESFMLYRNMTRDKLNRDTSQDNRLYVSGWVFSPDGPITVTVISQGNAFVDELELQDSPEIYDRYLSRGKDYPGARRAYFEAISDCPGHCELRISNTQGFYQSVPLDGDVKRIDSGDLQLKLQLVIGPDDYFVFDPASSPSEILQKKFTVLEQIWHAYQSTIPWLFLLALISYSWQTWRLMKYHTNFILWLVSSCLLAAVVARVVLVTIVDTMLFPAIFMPYLTPAYPLMLAFISLSLMSLGKFRAEHQQ